MVLRLSKYLYVHIGFLVLACFSFFTPATRLFWMTFAFAGIHEGFHYLAACLFHVPVRRITLLPYGFQLRTGCTYFGGELVLTLAGPLGSFLLYLLFQDTDAGAINGMLALINLLPALPLDGGRLLRLVIWRFYGTFRGNRMLRFTGLFFGILLFLFAAVRKTMSAAYVGWILCSYPLSPVPLLQKKHEKTRAQKLFPVSSRDTLLTLSHCYSPFYIATFYVVDKNCFLPEEVTLACLRENAAARVVDALLLLH